MHLPGRIEGRRGEGGRGVVGGSIRGSLKSVSGGGGEVVKKHVRVGLVCTFSC